MRWRSTECRSSVAARAGSGRSATCRRTSTSSTTRCAPTSRSDGTAHDVDNERVVEAVRLAGLEDVVAELPDGLDTIVGERGVRLSGGQRQRVGLARALYIRPTVLVLDEATSNLDQATEHRIVETLGALQGDITMIVVTHRIASVRHCERVLYLEQGTVRALGSLDEIRAVAPGFEGPPAPRSVAQIG